MLLQRNRKMGRKGKLDEGRSCVGRCARIQVRSEKEKDTNTDNRYQY